MRSKMVRHKTQNLYAKKHSVTVHAVFHSSLRPRDGKEDYAVALGFDIMGTS